MYVRFCEHMQSAQYRHDLEQEIALETVPYVFHSLIHGRLVCIVHGLILGQTLLAHSVQRGWLGSRVVSVLDSGAEGPRLKSQPRCCRVTVLGKLFTPIVPLFSKQQNW